MEYSGYKRRISTVLWVCVNAVILVLSLIPMGQVVQHVSFNDKIAHGIAYAVLGFVTYGFIVYHELFQSRSVFFLISSALFYCWFVGGGIELIQPFVGRSRDVFDFLFDILGSSVGIFGAYWVMRRALDTHFYRKQ